MRRLAGRTRSTVARLVAVLLLLVSAGAPALPARADDPADLLDPDLIQTIGSSRDGTARVVVQMKGAADLRVAAATPDIVTRRRAVAQTLQARAATAQGPILTDLQSRPGVK